MATESSADSEALPPQCAFSVECFSFSKLFTCTRARTPRISLLLAVCSLIPLSCFSIVFFKFFGRGGGISSVSLPAILHIPELGES